MKGLNGRACHSDGVDGGEVSLELGNNAGQGSPPLVGSENSSVVLVGVKFLHAALSPFTTEVSPEAGEEQGNPFRVGGVSGVVEAQVIPELSQPSRGRVTIAVELFEFSATFAWDRGRCVGHDGDSRNNRRRWTRRGRRRGRG